jgi:hypothetical protein
MVSDDDKLMAARMERKGRWSAEELDKLAAEREARFAKRRAIILADPDLDPRVAQWYLDREIWDTSRAAREMGIRPQRVTELRGGRTSSRRRHPHPGMLPQIDVIVGYIADVAQPGVEAGALREWLVERGSHRLDRATGKLIKVPWRVGRSRADRPTLSKPHRAGTPRKGKKGGRKGDNAE